MRDINSEGWTIMSFRSCGETYITTTLLYESDKTAFSMKKGATP